MTKLETLAVVERACPNVSLKAYKAALQLLDYFDLEPKENYPVPFQYQVRGIRLQFMGFSVNIGEEGEVEFSILASLANHFTLRELSKLLLKFSKSLRKRDIEKESSE